VLPVANNTVKELRAAQKAVQLLLTPAQGCFHRGRETVNVDPPNGPTS
jgi:hypothetical protein